MKLVEEQLRQLSSSALTPSERAALSCRVAAELTHTGQYEAARESLGQFWRGAGARPELDGLESSVAAEVLLRCGVLSGWPGGSAQRPVPQEEAKDLLTEALRRFEVLNLRVKVSEALYELGVCYWRDGAYDASRVVLDQAARRLDDAPAELMAKVLIRRTMPEISEGEYRAAWDVLTKAEPFVVSCKPAVRGRWHGQLGLVFRGLAAKEGASDFYDKALVEFTAAARHFEQARHERCRAVNLNNAAFVLYKLARYQSAHENIERASEILTGSGDRGLLAQVKETRARVLVAEGRYKEAGRVIAEALKTLEKGGEVGLIADALALQAVVWSKLGMHERSMRGLRRALTVAEEAGSLSSAGLAALTLIEEHGEGRLAERELHDLYLRADRLLSETRDAEHVERLLACARVAVRRLFLLRAGPGDEGFVLPRALEAYEARLIESALEEGGGSVTRAAKRLGVSHQALIQMLNTRHRRLLDKRTPARPRRRSIVVVREARGGRA